ncbi:hypothetical protein AB0I52_31485, partial [Streptomyces sp. NPDC050423]
MTSRDPVTSRLVATAALVPALTRHATSRDGSPALRATSAAPRTLEHFPLSSPAITAAPSAPLPLATAIRTGVSLLAVAAFALSYDALRQSAVRDLMPGLSSLDGVTLGHRCRSSVRDSL